MIDLAALEELASIQCTDDEIAAVLGVSTDTLGRRKADDPAVLAAYANGKARGRVSIRRQQWIRAQSGSDTMLIWLGKNILNQKDRSELTGADNAPVLTGLTVTLVRPGDKP